MTQIGPAFRSPPDSLNGLTRLLWIDPATNQQKEFARWRGTAANVAAVTGQSSAVAAIPFGARSTWELTKSGSILLSHGSEYHVRILHGAGGEQGYRRPYKPVALTPRERDNAAQKVAGYAPALREQVKLPRTKPAIEDLQLSDNGCLWVRANAPGQTVAQRWELFNTERSWVSTVLLPANFRVMHVSPDRIYFVSRDSMDLESVGYLEHSLECGHSGR